MATRSSEAPVVLASERAQSGRWAGGRRALWVVGAFGLIAVLVFQYANELADLNAYGRKYLTKGRAPPRVRLFEREPRDVVVKEELVAKPPAAAREEPRRAPPPPAEVPSPRDAGGADPGKPPAPSLEEYGWVAWPPPNPPPAGREGVSQSDAGTSASVENRPPPPAAASGGPKASTEGASPKSGSGSIPGYDGWDAKVGWPPSAPAVADASGKPAPKPAADGPGDDTASEDADGEWRAPPDWDGWVAWPPPNPPPPSRR